METEMEITPYKTLREKIKTGDVLICEGEKGFSKFISFATKSKQTHVGFLVVLEDIDRIIVVESVESKGVRPVALSKYVTDYDNKGNPYHGEIYIARHKDFEKQEKDYPEKLEEMLIFAVDAMGYPYSVKQIVRIAYYILFKKVVNTVLSAMRKEWICSVFIGELYKVFGLIVRHEEKSKFPYLIPADFVNDEKFEIIGRLK